jgi:hypothetical protein
MITLLYLVNEGLPLSLTARMMWMVPSRPPRGITNHAFAALLPFIFIGASVLADDMTNEPASG